jgi:elongation factor 1 alpha-like protein
LKSIDTMPKGRLLGGSSKLAALAAARKKKEAEKAAAAAESTTDRSINLLDRLGKDKSTSSEQSVQTNKMTFPTRQKRQSAAKQEPQPEARTEVPEASPIQREDLRANPSTFAETLLGNGTLQLDDGVSLNRTTSNDGEVQADRSFTLPYMSDPEYAKRDPFAKPSPDDVVLRAQSKDSQA